jgi:flagellar protein FlgJ
MTEALPLGAPARPAPLERPGAAGPRSLTSDAASRDARLREASEEFEAILLTTLVKEMRRSLGPNGLFGEGPGRTVYEGMFDTMLAGEIARGAPLGIAEQIHARWTSQPPV